MIRTILPLMRVWFWVDCMLVFIAGVQLYVLSEATDRFFAWTIMPPLTAAFLGANYWASLLLLIGSARRRAWADARIAVFGVWVFTALTLLVTLLHLDRFHLSSPVLTARLAAWIWLAVYVAVPITLLALAVWQQLQPGGDPVRSAPLPLWARALLAVQALVMVALGLLLFVLPTAPVWPWTLTPLTGRAVAAWLIALAVIVTHMNIENDWTRVQPSVWGFAVLGVLQLAALARYPGTVAWASLPAVGYILLTLSWLVMGVAGIAASAAQARRVPAVS